MNVQMPKCYYQLKPSEKARIEEAIFDRLDEELCDAQIIWIKMACGILHRIGLTQEQVLQFIGLWKTMYRKNSRLADKAEQTAFLDGEMSRIFGEGGFPEAFVQSLREIGR